MKTVLVVDDSPIVLEMTGAALRNAGYRVITRSRAEGTVAAVLQERPDLVLLDVNMPHISGETIAVILSKANSNRQTIVLLHSTLPPEQLKRKAIETGAHGYLHKTGSALGLVNQVNQWLRRASTSSQGTEPLSSAGQSSPAAEPEAPAGPPPVRASGASRRTVPEVLFVDDDHFALSLYRRALKTEPFAIDLADTGARAISKILSPNPPDVVVCDLLMPDTDGIRVFERAVEHDRSWRRRFVFVTGAASDVRINQFLADDATAVVYKPVDVGMLLRAIRLATVAAGAAEAPNRQ